MVPLPPVGVYGGGVVAWVEFHVLLNIIIDELFHLVSVFNSSLNNSFGFTLIYWNEFFVLHLRHTKVILGDFSGL